MRFDQLLDHVLEEAEVREQLDLLVARKKNAEELAAAPKIEVLSQFAEVELQRLDALNEPDEVCPDSEQINVFFREFALAEN